jgi:glutaminyl-peptide cyclotransferase
MASLPATILLLAVSASMALTGCSREASSNTLPTVASGRPTVATGGANTTGGAAPGAGAPSGNPSPPMPYRIDVLGTYPHDETAWTEGLELYHGLLLESAGRPGQSSLRLSDPRTGELQEVVKVAGKLYAEGVTVVDGRAVQLTWTDETLLTTNLPNLSPVTARANAYDGEGWGLCYDGTDLVMSDGSAQLQFRDPTTFELRRTVPVTLNGVPLERVNELECVEGQVWANVWLTTSIVVIDPLTGTVTGTADVAELVPEQYRGSQDAVPNGIAHDPDLGTFWLTGKLWPVSYEVRLVPA